MQQLDLQAITVERERLRAAYLHDSANRPPSTARGVHHIAVPCADVEQTVKFYQELLEFPLVEMFENRDYRGSTHFFFDIGHGNRLAFFDFPGLDLGDYREVLGGLHHLALSMETEQWERIKAKLQAAGVDYQQVGDTSLYFRDPDGTRLELTRHALGAMSRTQRPNTDP